MYPEKLSVGDEIRVIAPSRSMSIISKEVQELATSRLESLGLKVTFGKNVMKCLEDYNCASIEDRIEDLHDAFKDKNVKAILTVVGGFNANQLLPYIDYNLIKNNPKIFCGLSDITVLQNAIYSKTGLITYSGLHYSSFGMKKGFEYSLNCFKKIFMNNCEEFFLPVSQEYSSEEWYLFQNNRTFYKNDGLFSVNYGIAKGIIIGGNLCTLNLLQGTEYMPKIKNCILFLEDTSALNSCFLLDFDRNLTSLLQSIDINEIKGIVIGRAENKADMNNNKWKKMLEINKKLKNIPIIINANFGHTTPSFVFPIGGLCEINSSKVSTIKIIKK